MRFPWRRKEQAPRLAPDGGDWSTYHLRTGRNVVHDHLWPECNLPMGHGHDLGVLVRPGREHPE